MANYKVVRAFRRAAETILDRPLSGVEMDRIIEGYESATGSTHDRAIKGLAFGVYEPEDQIRANAASSDRANNVMFDLQTVLDETSQ